MVYKEVWILRIYLLLCSVLVWGVVGATCIPAFGFQFIYWPEWMVVKPGEDVQLSCATNLLPDTIQWYYNHRPLLPGGPKINVHSASTNGSSLWVNISKERSVFEKQEGLYQCVATVGPVSIISLPGRIRVAFLQEFPSALVTHRSLLVTIGSVLIIPCRKPDSLPEAEIIFYKDGKRLETNSLNKYFTTAVGDLVILKVDESTKGTYFCSAFNHLLNLTVRQNSSTDVSLEASADQPSFSMPFNFIYTNQSLVMKGDAIILLCVAHGHEGSSYEWWMTAHSSTAMKRIADQHERLLEINVEDGGVFACHVKSRKGSTSSNISVFVQESPFIKTAPKNVSLQEGQGVSLKCSFGGSPLPAVSWVFNGKFLVGRHFLAFENELLLRNLSLDQAGIYQCFAFNPSGTAQGTALVQVIPRTVYYPNYNDLISISMGSRNTRKKKKTKHRKGKKKKRTKLKVTLVPSKPTITKLTDESVLVAWTLVSERAANKEIMFYKVQFKYASPQPSQIKRWRTVSETIIPPATTCEITGLVVDNYYRFRVAAVYRNNDHKFGPSTDKFYLEKSFRLQRPTIPPRILTLKAYSNDSIKISWSYESPVYTEGFIVNYRRTGILEDYTKVVLLGARRRRYILRHLKVDTPYDFKLSSFNMAGMSNYSDRKTFLPTNFLGYSSSNSDTSTAIPVVVTETQVLSATHLATALSTGFLILLAIVVTSFVLHWRQKRKNNRPGKIAPAVADVEKPYNDDRDRTTPFLAKDTTLTDAETLRMETSLTNQ